MNVLLNTDEVIREKRLAFQKQQKQYYNKTKENIKKEKTNDEKEILRLKRNERARLFYTNNKEKCDAYRIPLLSKINLYVSALNTGKILKINEQKFDEYHIKFNQDTNKYEVDTYYAISFYKKKNKKDC